MNFAKSLHERVAFLEGLSEEQLVYVWNRLEFQDGAISLLRSLKHAGYHPHHPSHHPQRYTNHYNNNSDEIGSLHFPL